MQDDETHNSSHMPKESSSSQPQELPEVVDFPTSNMLTFIVRLPADSSLSEL